MKSIVTKDSPRISIIVPAYNAQNTIIPCLKSLLESDLREIEIIVVDDGSSDGTFHHIQALQKKDPRIRLFWQVNNGVSAARNLGIQLAKGEYLGFCDSDDWVEPEMYSTMLKEAEGEEVDLVVCDHCKDSGNQKTYPSYDFPTWAIKGEEYCHWSKYALTNDYLEYPITCSVCTCLFKKNIITEYKIKFPVGITNGEDYIFGAHYTACAQSMVYLKGFAPYHYCDTPGSASKAASLRMVSNCKKLIPLIYKIFYNYSCISNLDEQIFLSQVRYISLSINSMIGEGWDLKRIYHDARELTNKVDYRSGMRCQFNYQLLIGQKIILLSIRLNMIEKYVFMMYLKGIINDKSKRLREYLKRLY